MPSTQVAPSCGGATASTSVVNIAVGRIWANISRFRIPPTPPYPPVDYTTSNFIYSSPALSADEQIFYIGWGGNAVAALSTQVQSGLCEWKWIFGLDIVPDGRWQSSPVVSASGVVYFATCDSQIHAVNGSTGAPIWNFSTIDPTRGAGTLGARGDLVIGADNAVVSLDAETGALRWRYNTTPDLIPCYTSPAIGAGGVVFMSSCLDDLTAINGTTGGLLWNVSMGSPNCDTFTHHSSPSVSPGGEFVVVGSNGNTVNAYDAATGAVRWVTFVNSYVWGTPIVDGSGNVFVMLTGGPLEVIDGVTGQIIVDYVIEASIRSISVPAIARRPDTGEVTVFVGGNDFQLYALAGGCVAGLPCKCFSGAQPTPDGSDCTPCPPGTYNAIPGDPCLSCEPNTFAAAAGTRQCAVCPPGTESAGGMTACVPVVAPSGPSHLRLSKAAIGGIAAGALVAACLLAGGL
jgi:outer membrane protein assembly factor BamB